MATRAGSFGFYAVGRQDAANTLDVNALRAELGAKPTVSRIKKWLIDNDMGPNVNKTQLAQWAQGWAEYAVSVTQGEREHRPPAKLPFAQLDGFIVQYVELYDELQHDIHVEGVFPRQLLALGLRMRDINGVFWDFLEESGRTGEETRPGKDVMVKLRRAEEMLRGTGAGRSWEALSRAQDALHYLGHAIEQMEKEPASLYGNLEKETAYRQTAAEGAMEKVTEAEAKKLGDAIGVDWREVFVEELARGIEVESEEHGIGKKKAAQIAYDHLKENENYYSKLKKAGLEAEDVAFYKPGDRVWLPRQNRTGRVESVDTDPSGRVRYDIAYVDRGGERKHVKVAPYEVRPGYMIATEDKACGCAEETGAADYPDMEAAFRGAQSKLDATHMVGRGSSTVVFSPTSKGYVTHHLERGGGSLHWFKGKTVDDLPVGATPIYESAIVDPERMAPKRREEKPGVRRAAEGDDDEPAPLTPRLLSAQPMPGTPAYSDWLRLKAEIEKEDEALARHQKRRPLPPPMSQRDIEAARRLQRRIGTVRSRVGMEEAEEGLEASERKNVEKVVAALAEASGGGRPNIFDDTVESIQRQRAARETAQPNPIDTGDGIPWIKIARDPEQYKAAMKLAERIGPIDDEKKIYELLGPAMLKEDQEVFCVVLLDVRHRVRGVVEAHRGERSRVAANMSDILRAAIKGGAESIVVTHNHPSGKAIPSEADKDLTKAIEKACRAVDIIFVDHVILGNGEYYSFADRKRYKAPKTKSKSQLLAAE